MSMPKLRLLLLVLLICNLSLSATITQTSSPTPHTPTITPSLSEQQDCQQHYPRLFFTKVPQKMLIKFDTKSPCNRSHVLVEQGSSITRYDCVYEVLEIVQMTRYLRYVQTCTIAIDTKQQEFRYSVYGQSGNNGNNHQQSRLKLQDQYRVNIPQADQNMNLIVLADWGPIRTPTPTPIYPALVREVQSNQHKVHALMIIGDLAYDLHTNQCLKYEMFMEQLVQVSPYWPIIAIHGNHQARDPFSEQIFQKSFQAWGLSNRQRVQVYQFWNLRIVAFNPYLQLYEKFNEQGYQLMKSTLLSSLQPNPKKPTELILLTSHYPLICSMDTSNCKQSLTFLPQLFNQISTLGQVDIYFSGHAHIYQRIAPFVDGHFTRDRRSPYGKGQMISIVEGVAGTQHKFERQDYVVEPWSMAHTYNKTGFGLLTVGELQGAPYGKFVHYVMNQDGSLGMFDQVGVDTGKRGGKEGRVQRQ